MNNPDLRFLLFEGVDLDFDQLKNRRKKSHASPKVWVSLLFQGKNQLKNVNFRSNRLNNTISFRNFHYFWYQIKFPIMKKTLLSSVFCFISFFLLAQPTLSSAYFVEAGDILITRIDKNPPTSISPQGTGEQTWDFSALHYDGTTISDTFSTADQGANSSFFPDAELVLIRNGSIEQYYNVTADRQELIGYAGNDPVGLGIFVNAPYDEPALFRSAPVKTFDNFNFSSSVSFAVDASQIPDTLLDKLPLSIDSARVSITNNQVIYVDAYGNMTIPGGTYNVLRLNTTEYRQNKIFAKLTYNHEWKDVTAYLGSLPGVGKDTIKHYDFYTDSEKEPIAQVYVDNNTEEVQNVVFKANPVSPVFDIHAPHPNLTAYPNPVENEVMFRLDNVPSGKYTIKIYNILGSSVWQKQYNVHADNKLIWENLQDLRKGTYLLSLIDENNVTLSTQRLIVIRP